MLAFAAQAKQKRLLSIDNYSYDTKCSLAKVVANLNRVGFNPAISDGRIVLLESDSREKPVAPVVDQVSLLFVDSDHFRRQFDTEMQVWLDSVVPGGIVACHDYNSPTWLEMTGAIDQWLKNRHYRQIGLARRLIGFEKLK